MSGTPTSNLRLARQHGAAKRELSSRSNRGVAVLNRRRRARRRSPKFKNRPAPNHIGLSKLAEVRATELEDVALGARLPWKGPI